ncbi:MAG: tRNA (N6-isopentenyl adenosine(37)-C2)-methylthiotransferase MiaB [Deltaproteobacteria bacterium]|nr:tRNA (N6-isopentenyl adenosine(37)-C2)-methylthiotransferase MiaB [Deltaproteobacteria bacterium]
MTEPRRFWIRTFGCQMNVHDSDKVGNLLHHAGYEAAPGPDAADLLIVNTCSIRDKVEHKLYSDLGKLREWKAEAPGRVVGVGGCVAQQEGDAILKRFDQVDFVFGTHNLRRVPALAEAAVAGGRAVRVEESASLDRFDLPERHPDFSSATPGRAFLTVMEGCDMFCSFCIVPTTRGREISRPAAGILEEARQLAGGGVREVTLLGQTVNAYGRHDVRRGHAAEKGTMPFAELLSELDAIPGLDRIRYTSPHPLFFDEALVAAHGELESLCPHVHLPVQSGSDRMLEAMRRRYTAEEYRGIVAALRGARPDIALTSDLIVGFPGETEADFAATLSLIEEVGLVDSFSFKYSPRPGTKAAELEGQVSEAEAQARLERLQALQHRLRFEAHRARLGETTEILVEGPSRRGGSQLRGRDPYHRLVNLDDASGIAAGALARVEIVEATPHSLIGEPLSGGLAENPHDGVKTGTGSADDLRRGEPSSSTRGEPSRRNPMEATG